MMQIRPYTPDYEPAVREFNVRMRATGERFPESHVPDFPRENGRQPYQDYFVVADGNHVHGGYKLYHQAFWIRDRVEMIAGGPQNAVSEGLVNPRFNMAGALTLVDALKRQPHLYILGIGGMQQRFAQLLKESEWALNLVPFYFKVLHPARFLAEIRYLRERPARSAMCDLLRLSGLGSVGITAAQLRLRAKNGCKGEIVQEFGDWANEIWERTRGEYSFIAVRDAAALAVVHTGAQLLRMRVSRGDQTIGWVVMLDTCMTNHKQFGNLRVGTIVDCLASTADAPQVIGCASEFLQDRGVDMMVSNQTHAAWRQAMFSCGFLRGPSNFVLALSPRLADKLQPVATMKHSFHMNRGDGDGPIHL
jgi:hypothetical protein